MTMALAFWVLMLVWVIFGLWHFWPNYGILGNGILFLMLFGLLGWKVFGAPIHG